MDLHVPVPTRRTLSGLNVFRRHLSSFSSTYRVNTGFINGADTSADSEWKQSEMSRFDLVSDLLASQHSPALAGVRLQGSGNASMRVADVQMQRLSTAFEYDGENLREVCFADGARQRTEFDYLGRPALEVAPDGKYIRRSFDGQDRVVDVTDAAGNRVGFVYNEVGLLSQFKLSWAGQNQVTHFAYDELDRLTTITYPDATFEAFTYSDAGDVLSYTDNANQVLAFAYDLAHRLTRITYADTTYVELGYNQTDALVTQRQRDGSVFTYALDDLDRVQGCTHTAADQTEISQLGYAYNEVGQLDGLNSGVARYGAARYGQSRYGVAWLWQVPSGDEGRDGVGRLIAVDDSQNQRTTLAYDVDGRLTQLAHPNGVTASLGYDVVGKLLHMRWERDGVEQRKIAYDYNTNRDRIAQHTERDAFIYRLDAAGRLAEECHNRVCFTLPDSWEQCEWNQVTLDRASGTMQLLPFEDSFAGNQIDASRWALSTFSIDRAYDTGPREISEVGIEVRQNNGLSIAYPRAATNQTWAHNPPVDNRVGQAAWISLNGITADVGYKDANQAYAHKARLKHRMPLVGDFDVALSFRDFDWVTYTELQFMVTPTDPEDAAQQTFLRVGRYYWSYGHFVPYTGAAQKTGTTTTDLGTPDYDFNNGGMRNGQLRLQRTGGQMTLSFRPTGATAWAGNWTTTCDQGPLFLFVNVLGENSTYSLALTQLQSLAPAGQFPAQGNVLCPIYDAGRSVDWTQIQWTQNCPTGTSIELEMAVSDDLASFSSNTPPTYFGPTGTGSKFTLAAGQPIPSGAQYQGRYAQVRATLKSNGTGLTPALSDLQVSFNATSPIESKVRRFHYDQAGNILSITTQTDAGTTLDLRDDPTWPAADRINHLNQLRRRDVDGQTYRFSYDPNGNLTSKSNGTDVTTYAWTQDNRLTQVSQSTLGSVVSFTYDQMGRMMTRTSGGVTTWFTWSGWTCVSETDGTTTTNYQVPEGGLLSFRRGNSTYQMHCDGLTSCRMVTDESGAVVSRLDWDAWGDLMPGSVDGVPGGTAYGFVGGAGVRRDPALGLHYMRNRWYDPELNRFISRDPIGLYGGAHLYAYSGNNPLKYSDPDGLILPVVAWAVLEAAGWGAASSVAIGAAMRYFTGQDTLDPGSIAFDATLGGLFAGGFSAAKNAYTLAKYGTLAASSGEAISTAAAAKGMTLAARQATAEATAEIGGKAYKLIAASGEKSIPGFLKMIKSWSFQSARAGYNGGLQDAERKLFEFLSKYISPKAVGSVRILVNKKCCPQCIGTAWEFMRRYPGMSVALVWSEKGTEGAVYLSSLLENTVAGGLAALRNWSGGSDADE